MYVNYEDVGCMGDFTKEGNVLFPRDNDQTPFHHELQFLVERQRDHPNRVNPRLTQKTAICRINVHHLEGDLASVGSNLN